MFRNLLVILGLSLILPGPVLALEPLSDEEISTLAKDPVLMEAFARHNLAALSWNGRTTPLFEGAAEIDVTDPSAVDPDVLLVNLQYNAIDPYRAGDGPLVVVYTPHVGHSGIDRSSLVDVLARHGYSKAVATSVYGISMGAANAALEHGTCSSMAPFGFAEDGRLAIVVATTTKAALPCARSADLVMKGVIAGFAEYVGASRSDEAGYVVDFVLLNAIQACYAGNALDEICVLGKVREATIAN